VYGNSKQTVVGRVNISHENGDSWSDLVLPAIVDHANDNKRILDAIQELHDSEEDKEKCIETSSVGSTVLTQIFCGFNTNYLSFCHQNFIFFKFCMSVV
jgi:hypothetical protein